ncbi:MAG: hypothetical protein IJV01_02465 [Bacteroidales bacterium]|nr:hypothetical protein [Bacteroidales bacterium]
MKRPLLVLLLALHVLCAGAFEPLFPKGRITLGANYWCSTTATDMWTKWDAAAVEADLKVLSENGFKVLRVFPNWRDFQPIVICPLNGDNFDVVNETRMFLSEEPLPDTPCGRAGVDERMVEHFEEFCDIAERHGIWLIVPLLTGQMTFRNFVPPALYHLNPYSDPYALKWEARYLECMVSRLKEKKAIIAWESGNEARILGRSENNAQSEFWLRFVHNTIRLADPSRPIIGVDGLNIPSDDVWPSEMNAALSDYTATHPYGMWGNVYLDDFSGIRSALFVTSQTVALEDIGGKPAFVEEHGARRQEQTNQTHLADYVRGLLWNLWAADCKAMLWWCAFDQTGQTIAPYNWRQPCVELGIFKRDRSAYPAVASVRRFAALQEKLPFEALPEAKADAVFLVSDADIAHSSYILARQAGIIPEFQSPEQKLKEADFYFLPSAAGRAYLTIEKWESLKERIRNGATLYVSWKDTFLDSIEEVLGVEVASRQGRTILQPTSAEIVRKAADGTPELFRNRYGAGTVYTLSHPLEYELITGTGGYDSDAYQIYNEVLNVPRLVKTDSRYVCVSEHRFSTNSVGVILVNNSGQAFSGRPVIEKGWRVVSSLTDAPDYASWDGETLRLERNSGILLLMKK